MRQLSVNCTCYARPAVFMDGSYAKAHQHSSGAATPDPEGIGKNRAGLTCKIHRAVDAMGLPSDFEITGGEVHDATAAPTLLEKPPKAESVVANKGYDSQKIGDKITEKDSLPFIPGRKDSMQGNKDMDWGLYKYRHLVENTFARVKHFRAAATRYDKLKRNYVSVIAMACCLMWLPMQNLNRPQSPCRNN